MAIPRAVRTSRTRSRLGSGVLAVTVAAGLAIGTAPPALAATGSTFVVLYNEGASTSGAAAAVTAAGGSLVADWPEIGVVVARSGNPAFAAGVRSAQGVQAVAATDGLASRLAPDQAADQADAAAPQVPVNGAGEPLAGLQWDMRQINAPAAQAITGGSPSVVVGDIDTGLDFTHPDLAPNYSPGLSTDCTSGAPAPLLAGNDANGHGTHTAGTIAAAANGLGIAGVAPNVRLAGIKSATDAGFFFPQAVICSFMWVARHPEIAVTNNSYFADPFLFNCRNDAGQRAIWTAERRAIRAAQSVGSVVVAAEGNESDDLSHPTQDVTSPDDSTPVTREITNACAVVPVEVPGVVGVTATGNKRIKSFYSSYGMSTTDVAAPGGDSVLQVTPDAVNGRVLSTWPAADLAGCRRPIFQAGALYCYQQGTSMASPHAAGVAALIVSGGKKGGAAVAALQQATTALPCPDTAQYAPFPSLSNGAPQTCTGGAGHNSFYGAGEVDALKAVG